MTSHSTEPAVADRNEPAPWKPGEPITSDSRIPAALFRDFYHNHWPRGWYHDDSAIELEDTNGEWVVPDDAVLPVADLGYAVWDGPDGDPWPSGETVPVAVLLRDWAARRDPEQVLVIAVPEDAEDALKDFLETIGGRVIGEGKRSTAPELDDLPEPGY